MTGLAGKLKGLEMVETPGKMAVTLQRVVFKGNQPHVALGIGGTNGVKKWLRT
jgi:hypothetical protein